MHMHQYCARGDKMMPYTSACYFIARPKTFIFADEFAYIHVHRKFIFAKKKTLAPVC